MQERYFASESVMWLDVVELNVVYVNDVIA